MQFKFVGDNVNKMRKVRDLRSDHQGKNAQHVLAVRSQIQSQPSLTAGANLTLSSMPSSAFTQTQDQCD